MNLGSMGKMIGPLPLGVWVATVGGAVGVGQLAKMRRPKSAPAAAVAANGSVPFYGSGLPMQEPAWSGATVGLSSSYVAPAPPPPKPAPPATNNEWQRAAIVDLSGRGFQVYATQQALAKYLQGLDPLTAEQAGIVEAALRYTGPPPNPPSVAPPPTPASPGVPRPPTPTGGAGTVDAPGTARTGAYFGLPGSGVAIDPADPDLGRWGKWQQGTYVSMMPGYREFAIAAINENIRKNPQWNLPLIGAR